MSEVKETYSVQSERFCFKISIIIIKSTSGTEVFLSSLQGFATWISGKELVPCLFVMKDLVQQKNACYRFVKEN